MTINPLFLHSSLFIHGYFISSPLACLTLNSKQLYHTSTVPVLLHIVMTICIFIKSPKEGRLDCPKYRENQLARHFFFAVQFNNSLVKRICQNIKTSHPQC